MTHPRIQRFDFGGLRDFRGPIVVNTAQAEQEETIYVEPPPPVFTLADIEAARLAGKKEGYQEGFLAGEMEAKNSFDNKTEQANEVIASIAQAVRAAQADYRKVLTKDAEYINALTLSIAKKIASDALDARAEQAILAIVERCLPVIFSKPKLTVQLHPDMFERVVDRIEDQIRTNGFDGEIQFVGIETIAKSDVMLNWGSGEISRSEAAIWHELETLIARMPTELTFTETHEPPTNTTGV
jgi:flagellar biosynthesis/type III secretory pathway protein FliH